ncbi:MAG: ferredoxin--nitrite reductase [Nitrospirae bacterium]|nr:MAG: ferredoxin--nitrite reductase [Nitrospirota bacterium]
MNKVEVLKAEKDGLDIRDSIDRFAKEGWQHISDDDVQRLKWYGLFLRNPTPGFFMIRVRISGGRASLEQVKRLAELGKQYGNGLLDITTRQQIQLRHLRIEDVPEVFRRMDEVGLCSLQTGMDNVRNIMTCPVAGLTTTELFDATPLVRKLTERLVGTRAYSNLPRKFNLAITGCVENCLHLETQDLAFVPATMETDEGVEHGWNVLAGGKLGSGGYRIATPLDIFVRAHEVVEVACAVVQLFRDYGNRESRTTSRLAFLLDEWGEEQFRVALESRVGRSLTRAGRDARKTTVNDHIGIYRQKQPGMNYVGLKIPVGRITADDLIAICDLADRYGSHELRFTVNQGVILPNIPDKMIGDLAEEPLVTRFAYNPSPVQKGLVSCVGNDYCNLAVIETKSQALKTAAVLEEKVGTEIKPITMHWSGCPSGCGNHLVADVGLIGKKVKRRGEIIEAVDVYVGGRSGPDPKPALKLLEDVPCDQLGEVLSGILPYHTRDKMHRAKTRAPKPRVATTPIDERGRNPSLATLDP